MIQPELNLVRENPQWLAVLEAYHREAEKLTGENSSEAQEPDSTSVEDSAAVTGEELTEDEPVAHQKVRRTPWLERVRKIEGLNSDELSQAHGRMIAYGLLQCDLPSRSAGVVYQLTSTGRQILAQLSEEIEKPLDKAA